MRRCYDCDRPMGEDMSARTVEPGQCWELWFISYPSTDCPLVHRAKLDPLFFVPAPELTTGAACPRVDNVGGAKGAER